MKIPGRFKGCIGCWLPGKHTHNGIGPYCPRPKLRREQP